MDITITDSSSGDLISNDIISSNSDEMQTSDDNVDHMEVDTQKQVDSTETVKVTVNTTLDEVAPAPLLIPSLKGIMTHNNGITICKGCWAMSDAAHGQPGQTSEFEFKLVKADEDSVSFPFSGKYQGWFALKQPPPMKGSIKIEDKEMKLSFSSQDNDVDFNIVGQGFNKFGSFNLHGTLLQQSGEVHLYREYYNLTPLSTTHSKRKASFSGGSPSDLVSESKRKSVSSSKPVAPSSQSVSSIDPSLALMSPPPATTPRESSGRVRKVSTLMKEYEEVSQVKAAAAVIASATPKHSNATTPKHSHTATVGSSSAAKNSAPPAVVRQESTSDRAQRLSAPLKKCGELLKEMVKHPQAVWFLEPVDFIKFNIPDYPTIIKQPMDFRTVRQNLEALKYDSHEAFAEHVRLVFRNAMTFNQLRDNPVHIAAREMSARFEDRYRQLTTQIGVYSAGSADVVYEPRSHTGAGRPSLGGSSSKKGKSGGSYNNKEVLRSTAPGPRPPVAYLPPAGDSSSHQIMEMQRMMLAMQEEINSLRSAVREGEIVKRLNETKDAAHHPLTFDEKKKLIAQIHKLPAAKMEQVLEIIQAAIPKSENDESGDIEVPLDALDTFTLRKLQKFIEENTAVKKKPVASGATTAPALQRQSSNASTKGEPGVKKPRKSNPAGSVSKQHLGGSLLTGDHTDGLMFDQGEDLLFSTDCFDELRGSQPQEKTATFNQNNVPPCSTTTSTFGEASAHVFSFESAVAESGVGENSNESFRRPRAGSLDEDFEDLMDMKSPAHSAVNLNDITSTHNADSWNMSAVPESSRTAESGGNGSSGIWSEAAQEFQAKKDRENELRAGGAIGGF